MKEYFLNCFMRLKPEKDTTRRKKKYVSLSYQYRCKNFEILESKIQDIFKV